MLRRRILVPTDFSPLADHAAAYAGDLARRLDVGLVLAHVLAFPRDWCYWDAPELDELRARAEAAARRKLARRAEELERMGTAVGTALSVGADGAAEVLAMTAAEEAGLIVLGTKGWRGEGLGLGAVAARVQQRAPVPVLTVGHADGSAERPRIVVALKAAASAGPVLLAARSFAAATDGRVEAVHVRAGRSGRDPDGALGRLATAALGSGTRVSVREGDPVGELLRYAARRRADVLIIGQSDHAGTAQWGLAARAGCPVLTVPAARPSPPTFEVEGARARLAESAVGPMDRVSAVPTP